MPAIRWLIAFLKRLGWFYVLALAVAAAALVMFARLADAVFEPGALLRINELVLRSLHAAATPQLNYLAIGLSKAGGPLGMSALTILLFALFYQRKRYLDGVILLLVMLGGLTLTFVLKDFFRIPRPALFISIMPEKGFSFPSGHSLNSVCLYGYLAALHVLENPKALRRWLAAAGICVIPAAIMWSRLYLGVHWLSDVAAGTLIAVFWLAMCLMLRRRYLARAGKAHSSG
jgi:undecaprenyl-diphosphatase